MPPCLVISILKPLFGFCDAVLLHLGSRVARLQEKGRKKESSPAPGKTGRKEKGK